MSTNQMQPLVTVGYNKYPVRHMHILPYTFGVRPPFEEPVPENTFENTYNTAYGEGAETAAKRVGLAGLIAGTLLGTLGVLLIQKLSHRGAASGTGRRY